MPSVLRVGRVPAILIGHPYWGRGGAEIAAMWMLQALVDTYRVDIVTRNGWNVTELNRCAETRIRPEQLGKIRLPAHSVFKQTTGGALWDGLYRRYCRHIAPEYDLCITASRIIDWGVPAIHFLTDVAWNCDLQKRFNTAEVSARSGLIRKAYWAFAGILAGKSSHNPIEHDLIVANSKWTATISANYCKQPPIVVYPAVPSASNIVPWVQRDDSFLCLGRISPEKRIENVIQILDRVRANGRDIRLHLVGNADDTPYSQHIQQLCHARKAWIVFHGPLYGAEKQVLMGRCRYGISACEREAFGIATAEMMRSGTLPFVPRAGAQSEIVACDPLIYSDIQDAAEKIEAVLCSSERQRDLHTQILKNSSRFTPEAFCTGVRDLVTRALVAKKR